MRQVITDDGRDLLYELRAAGAEFLVVGAHALAVHGVSRATVDLDVFVRPEPANAARVIDALLRFGAPLTAHGVSATDFQHPNNVYQMGLPPNRIDILTSIAGVTFEQAWAGRVESEMDGLGVPFLGRAELIQNKQAAGRLKDLADVEALVAGEGGPRRSRSS